jgi:hypothetical protein
MWPTGRQLDHAAPRYGYHMSDLLTPCSFIILSREPGESFGTRWGWSPVVPRSRYRHSGEHKNRVVLWSGVARNVPPPSSVLITNTCTSSKLGRPRSVWSEPRDRETSDLCRCRQDLHNARALVMQRELQALFSDAQRAKLVLWRDSVICYLAFCHLSICYVQTWRSTVSLDSYHNEKISMASIRASNFPHDESIAGGGNGIHTAQTVVTSHDYFPKSPAALKFGTSQ